MINSAANIPSEVSSSIIHDYTVVGESQGAICVKYGIFGPALRAFLKNNSIPIRSPGEIVFRGRVVHSATAAAIRRKDAARKRQKTAAASFIAPGKSAIVKKVAKELGLPVIDVPLVTSGFNLLTTLHQGKQFTTMDLFNFMNSLKS